MLGEYTKASFATERTRKGKENLDNLTRDVLRAEALGYGCHYGQYKTDHPHTRVDDVTPERQPVAPGRIEKTCARCGGTFYVESQARKRYCSPECEHAAKLERARKRDITMGKVGKNIPCRTCGKEFLSIHNRKYCCEACKETGRKLNAERNRQKYKEEATKHGND